MIWKKVYTVFFKVFLKSDSVKLYRVMFFQDVFKTCLYHLLNCTYFLFHKENLCLGEELTQQTFVGLQDASKTSPRHVLKTSSTRLQRNFFSSSKTFSRCLEDVLKTSCKTSLRRLGRQKLLRWRHLKKTWRNALKMPWRHALKMFTWDICI